MVGTSELLKKAWTLLYGYEISKAKLYVFAKI